MAGLFSSRMATPTRLLLYKKIAHSLENDQSIEFALESLQKRFLKRGKRRVARMIQEILEARMNGSTFTQAMGRHLPEQEAGVIAAGEASGKLAQALSLVISRDGQKKRIRASITQSLAPAVLNLMILFGTLYIIGGYVMPAMGKIVPPDQWRGSAHWLYLAGESVLGWHGPALIGGLVVLVTLVLWSLPRYTWVGRVFLEQHVFPYGVYRDVAGLDWGMSLAALLSAGVSDVEAINMQRTQASRWLRSRLDAVYDRMRYGGENLADALERTGLHFPSPEIIQDIGAISGFPDFYRRLPPMLEANAEDLERTLKSTFAVLAILINLLVYTLFGLVQVASNDIGAQISTMVH